MKQNFEIFITDLFCGVLFILNVILLIIICLFKENLSTVHLSFIALYFRAKSRIADRIRKKERREEERESRDDGGKNEKKKKM